MNSRKLRVLALLLSAIMIFTAVPASLFAEDFTSGEGFDASWDDSEIYADVFLPDQNVEEAVSFDDGFSSDVADEDEEPSGFDSSEVFSDELVSDETVFDIPTDDLLFVSDSEPKTSEPPASDSVKNAIDLDKTSVKFYYNDDTKDDYTVTYEEYNLNTLENVGGVITCGVKATVKESTRKAATCTAPATFKLAVTIPGYEKYGEFLSEEFTEKGSKPLGHSWGKAQVEITKYPTCSETGMSRTVRYCQRPGCGQYDPDTLVTEEIPATGAHNLVGTATVTYASEPPVSNGTVVLEGDVDIDLSTYTGNTIFNTDETKVPEKKDGATSWGYYKLTSQDCTICKKSVVKVEAVFNSDVTISLGKTSNIASSYTATLENYVEKGAEPATDKIKLADCNKAGYYTIVYTKEIAGKEDEIHYKKVDVPAHHVTTTNREYFVYKDSTYSKKRSEAKAAYANYITVDPETGNATSLGCQDTYYTAQLLCDACGNTVGDVEKKVAKGNDKLHIMDPTLTINLSTAKVKTNGKDKYDWTVIGSAFKTDGVKYSAYADFSGVTCADGGDIHFICTVCGDVIPDKAVKVEPTEHDWGSFEVVASKAAGCTEDGFITSAKKCQNPWCSSLSEEKTQKLTKTGHDTTTNAPDKVALPTGKVLIGKAVGSYVNLGKVKEKPYSEIKTKLSDFSDQCEATTLTKCGNCGEYVDLKDGTDVLYTVKAIAPNQYRCKAGSITVEAKYTNIKNKTYTDEKTYEFWNTDLDYAGRTNHEDDGTGKCKICGDKVKPEPVAVTTEAPVVATTEAPVAATTTAPVEATTKAPVEATTEAPVEATTDAPAPATMPAQVMGLKVTKNSPTKKVIAVKYSAVDNADQYTVNVRKAGTTAWTKNLTDGAVTAYEITGLTRGEAYDIRVAAIAKGIAGPRSGHLYRWLEKVTLEKPKRLSATSVSISWNDVGASKYKVYYSTDKSFKTGVKTGVVKDNGAIITELTPGKYYFKVRCYKTIDGITYTGAWSNVKSKTMK